MQQKLTVFFAWSGKISKAVAEALGDCLKSIFDSKDRSLEPWISESAIASGMVWTPELLNQLRAIHLGILCLTEENFKSQWIAFEAGALLKTSEENRIIPYLFDLDERRLSGSPLEQLQFTTANEKGTLRLVLSINSVFKPPAFPEDLLKKVFPTTFWPPLAKKFKRIPERKVEPLSNGDIKRIIEDLEAVATSWGAATKMIVRAIPAAKLLQRELERKPRALKSIQNEKGKGHAKRT